MSFCKKQTAKNGLIIIDQQVEPTTVSC